MTDEANEIHKVQFNFSKKALEDLDDLKEEIDAPSRAETIRYALRWLQWTVDEAIEKGNTLCIATPDGIVREVVIPFLSKRRQKDNTKTF
jgi:hypothetical protein